MTTFLSFFFNFFLKKIYEQLLIHLKNKNCLFDDPLTPFGPYNKLPIIKTAYNKLGTTFSPWAVVVKDQTTPFLIFLCIKVEFRTKFIIQLLIFYNVIIMIGEEEI